MHWLNIIFFSGFFSPLLFFIPLYQFWLHWKLLASKTLGIDGSWQKFNFLIYIALYVSYCNGCCHFGFNRFGLPSTLIWAILWFVFMTPTMMQSHSKWSDQLTVAKRMRIRLQLNACSISYQSQIKINDFLISWWMLSWNGPFICPFVNVSDVQCSIKTKQNNNSERNKG